MTYSAINAAHRTPLTSEQDTSNMQQRDKQETIALLVRRASSRLPMHTLSSDTHSINCKSPLRAHNRDRSIASHCARQRFPGVPAMFVLRSPCFSLPTFVLLCVVLFLFGRSVSPAAVTKGDRDPFESPGFSCRSTPRTTHPTQFASIPTLPPARPHAVSPVSPF